MTPRTAAMALSFLTTYFSSRHPR